MTVTEGQMPGSALETLLCDEARALRELRFDDLSGIADHKERLVVELVSAPLDPGHMQRLRALSARNASLTESVMAGLRSALAVLDVARSGGAGLQTYDDRGARRSMAGVGERPVRRA